MSESEDKRGRGTFEKPELDTVVKRFTNALSAWWWSWRVRNIKQE